MRLFQLEALNIQDPRESQCAEVNEGYLQAFAAVWRCLPIIFLYHLYTVGPRLRPTVVPRSSPGQCDARTGSTSGIRWPKEKQVYFLSRLPPGQNRCVNCRG